jgi:hypothetical protein
MPTWAEIALADGVLAFGVVGAVRLRAGYVALPGFGRQPFVVVFIVSWALAASGAFLFGLARTPAGPTAALLASANGFFVFLRGRKITSSGQRDPIAGRRNALIAAHGAFVVGVIALMAAGQL